MTDPTLFPDDRCTGCGQTPKGDGCWVCRPCGRIALLAGKEPRCLLPTPCTEVDDEPCLCGTDFTCLARHCPDHPTIPRADCVCPYPGEESQP